ncbi:amidase [Nocardioides pocheonensis]|uniref:Amidase n=1 Tax=Nocardioides pocheonensis TaxID=661485 RepID=A0A3N0GGX5_9ACTN|nr:amidase [Nocardioides pocheonensis]RNM11707.1 amidase [Nocardioides pocheonensis]
MPIKRPDAATIAEIAAGWHLELSEASVEQYLEATQALLDSCDVVESLYAEMAPVAPERRWTRPDEADNPLGAWYVKTEIQETTEGPLAGMRLAIKDNTSVGGVPMMNGSRMLEGFIPSEDATVVSRLLAAGAIVAGKAVCEDLCMSAGSHTSKPGPVHSPWDPDRSAGGSSSGSSVLVATGAVDAAISGDQGGSIRIPAAWNGLVGHKPTWGLVPYTGAVPIEQSLDHLGPTTRTVMDAARILNVIAGPDGMDPRQPLDLDSVDYVAQLDRSSDGLRLGVVSEGFGHDNSEAVVDETVWAAVDRLRSAGAFVENVSIPWHRYAPAVFSVIASEGALRQLVEGNTHGSSWKGRYDPELIEFYGSKWREDPDQFPESVKLTMLGAGYTRRLGHGRHYAIARNLELSLTAAYDAALTEYDVLIMPTSPIRPTVLPEKDASIADTLARGTEMLANTAPFDVTGHPACSVPVDVADGLPTGMMIIGRKFDDATVLRVAHAYEALVGGFPTPTFARSSA